MGSAPLTSSSTNLFCSLSLRNTFSISTRVAVSSSNNATVGSAASIGCAAPSLAKAFDISAATASSFFFTEPGVDLIPSDDAVENAADSMTNGFEGRRVSFEYGQYGNYTTEAVEAKIRRKRLIRCGLEKPRTA